MSLEVYVILGWLLVGLGVILGIDFLWKMTRSVREREEQRDRKLEYHVDQLKANSEEFRRLRKMMADEFNTQFIHPSPNWGEYGGPVIGRGDSGPPPQFDMFYSGLTGGPLLSQRPMYLHTGAYEPMEVQVALEKVSQEDDHFALIKCQYCGCEYIINLGEKEIKIDGKDLNATGCPMCSGHGWDILSSGTVHEINLRKLGGKINGRHR